jgi:hypothetical protein
LFGCGDIGITMPRRSLSHAAWVRVTTRWTTSRATWPHVFHFGNESHLPTLHDVDAVLVATPHHTHVPIALAAFGRRQARTARKSFAQNLNSARRIDAAAAASPLKTGAVPMRTAIRQRLGGDRRGTRWFPPGVVVNYLWTSPGRTSTVASAKGGCGCRRPVPAAGLSP